MNFSRFIILAVASQLKNLWMHLKLGAVNNNSYYPLLYIL